SPEAAVSSPISSGEAESATAASSGSAIRESAAPLSLHTCEARNRRKSRFPRSGGSEVISRLPGGSAAGVLPRPIGTGNGPGQRARGRFPSRWAGERRGSVALGAELPVAGRPLAAVGVLPLAAGAVGRVGGLGVLGLAGAGGLQFVP